MALSRPDLSALDTALIAAHQADDREAMAALYHRAAQAMIDNESMEEAAFFLTQAYVLSLDCGDREQAAACHRQLVAMGREQ
ncbi:MAG: hypothetical protein R3D57_18715 [Hyphomicrobiaceae bacterium]